MSYRILARNLPDGRLEITYPAPQLLEKLRTFDAALAYLAERAPSETHATTWNHYQAADPYWHSAEIGENAMSFDPEGKRFVIDMPKARALHMKRIRAARNAALARLDAVELEAQSKGDGFLLSETQAKKQALRNLPAALDLDSVNDPASLKGVWPEELR